MCGCSLNGAHKHTGTVIQQLRHCTEPGKREDPDPTNWGGILPAGWNLHTDTMLAGRGAFDMPARFRACLASQLCFHSCNCFCTTACPLPFAPSAGQPIGRRCFHRGPRLDGAELRSVVVVLVFDEGVCVRARAAAAGIVQSVCAQVGACPRCVRRDKSAQSIGLSPTLVLAHFTLPLVPTGLVGAHKKLPHVALHQEDGDAAKTARTTGTRHGRFE